MKIYIELGAFRGGTLASKLEQSKEIDLVVAFEPVPQLFALLKERFKENEKVVLHNLAVGIEDKKEVKLYTGKLPRFSVGDGSTLFSEKESGGIREKDFILVPLIDFSKFVEENFKSDDYISLRINIEGGEYDLLEHLIKTKIIHYFNEILCYWHHGRCFKGSGRITVERQGRLLGELKEIFGDSIDTGIKNSILEYTKYQLKERF